jgi:hypothetical protein
MKHALTRLGIAATACVFLTFTATEARADDGVARISVIHGTVTMQHGDSGDQEAAGINAPLSAGDYLSTGPGARAEIQFDNENFVRVWSDSQLRFAKLDAGDHEVQIAQGTIELRVLRRTDANPQVDTPSISIRPDEAGSYRITVDAQGNTLFTVREGRADLLAPQGIQTIEAGSTVRITGPSSDPVISDASPLAYDDFDSWNAQRDRYEERAYDVAYVNPGIVGLDDLDAYGHWVWVPDYGRVWVPDDEDEDWAPYTDGRWAWEPYYGWTWIGYEPWGWAPYHYGRWFFDPIYGWVWWPGPVYAPVAYCPGVVAFLGFGGGGFSFSIGFGFGFGTVAWVPLAPGEPFYPWWGSGFGWGNVTNINITNVTVTNVNITKIYRNINAPHGVIAVNVRDFQNGHFGHYLPVDRARLADAGLVKGVLPIKPNPPALRVTDRPIALAHVPPLSPRFHIMPFGGAPRFAGSGMQGPRLTATGNAHAATGAHPAFHRLALAQRPAPQPDSALAPAGSTGRRPLPLASDNKPAAVVPHSAWDRFDESRGTAVAPHVTERPQPFGVATATHRSFDRFSGFGLGPASDTNRANRRGPQPGPAHPAPPNAADGAGVWRNFHRGSGFAPATGDGFGARTAPSAAQAPRFHEMSGPARTAAPVSPWGRFGERHPATYSDRPAYGSMPADVRRTSWDRVLPGGGYEPMHGAGWGLYGARPAYRSPQEQDAAYGAFDRFPQGSSRAYPGSSGYGYGGNRRAEPVHPRSARQPGDRVHAP